MQSDGVKQVWTNLKNIEKLPPQMLQTLTPRVYELYKYEQLPFSYNSESPPRTIRITIFFLKILNFKFRIK